MFDLNQFIKITLNNYNYFPLIDYNAIANNFIIQYSDYINKIEFDSTIDETVLIDRFWNHIMEITNNQTQADFICQIIYNYYINSATHVSNIYQIINVQIDNNDYLFEDQKSQRASFALETNFQVSNSTSSSAKNNYLFYDINFFDTPDIISQESLNNIKLFFLIYSKTNNLNLANRLKTRYIDPLIDTINEHFIDTLFL